MKERVRWVRNTAVMLKFTLQRGWAWVQVPSFAMIGAGVMKPYFPNWSLYSLAFLAFVIILGVGFIDKYFRMLHEEQRYATVNNPTLMQILSEVIKKNNGGTNATGKNNKK